MPLKAVLFDFGGVIINDEMMRKQLVEALLVEENLRPNSDEYCRQCLGRSDRACLTALFELRGRIMTPQYFQQLSDRKATRYQTALAGLDKLPIYPGLTDFLFQLRAAHIATAIVSGSARAEVMAVLDRAHLIEQFTVVVAGEDIALGSPEPDGYLTAIDHLNQKTPSLHLTAGDCLVIDDTPAGIQAAKAAGMAVVGVANTYPFHMMQRQANWAVDYLSELEIERIRRVFDGTERQGAVD